MSTTTTHAMTTPFAPGDMKAASMRAGGITASRPKLSLIPRIALVYTARALGYGMAKYRRGNFYGPCPDGIRPEERLLGYIDAAQRHLARVADALNRALGTGGDLAAAASTADTFAGGGFPASGLPDLAHALASIAIGVLCAVDDGLMPEDPGEPWLQASAGAAREPGLPQKDDTAAERARVDGLLATKRRETAL